MGISTSFVVSLEFNSNYIFICDNYNILLLIIYISQNQFFFIIHLLLISSYVAQYSGYYLNNFIVNNPHVNKITIAVLFESIPYAVTGVTLSYYKIMESYKNIK